MGDWINYGKNWEAFCDENLNKSGTQIVVQNRHDLTKHNLHLIGDINEEGSGCWRDDYSGIFPDETVIRYRVLEI